MKAVRAGRPIWVQLALPWLTALENAWVEGSLDPWADVDAPNLSWTRVEDVLELVGLGASVLDPHEKRLLSSLPSLYGRDVAHAARELGGGDFPGPLRFFSTLAFRPILDTFPPRFRTVRTTVAVIRNFVVTVRLPDVWWDDESGIFDYSPAGGFDVARRFYPAVDELSAEDVAEAIAAQHASTAREIGSLVRVWFTRIERTWQVEVASSGRGNRGAARRDLWEVIQTIGILNQHERQLARFLRRLSPDGSDAARRAVPPSVTVRYQFALDELRSLLDDVRLAPDAVRQAIAAGEQEERDRFDYVAALLASVILIPTLVASIYGANVKLPAENSSQGLVALLLFILGFALTSFVVLLELFRRGRVPGTSSNHGGAARVAAAIVAALALAGGVLEVMR